MLSAFGVIVMDGFLLAGGEGEGSGFRRGGFVDVALSRLEVGERAFPDGAIIAGVSAVLRGDPVTSHWESVESSSYGHAFA